MASLTELEAVNLILSASGEDKVNALGSDLSDTAEGLLRDVSREIQEYGWHFNTEVDYSFNIDGDGFVTLPDNVAAFDLPSTSSLDVVMRGNRLYDRYNHTYVFSGSVLKGTVTWLLEWDELPPTARKYFALEAAHRYQKQYGSSDTIASFTDEDLRKARATFKSAEAIQADYTIFDNYDVARTLDRHSGSEFI